MNILASRWWLRGAVGFWALLAAVVTVKCLVKPTVHSDYPIYCDAGRDWWAPGQYTLHCPPAYLHFFNRQYGPAFVELVGPFALLPMSVGGALWSLVSAGILYSGLRRAWQQLAPVGPPGELGLFLFLAPWCGLHSLYNGQANVLLAGCLVWAVVAIDARRWLFAGLCLAVPALTKTYPAAAALVLMALYPRRLVPAFVLACAALTAASFALHPADRVLDRYHGWVTFLLNGENSLYHAHFSGNIQDVRLLVSRWLVPVTPRQFIPVQILTGGLVLGCVLLHRRHGDARRTLVYAYLLTAMWLVLFGPCTQIPTFLLAGPAVAWVLVEARRDGAGWGRSALLVAAAMLAGPMQTTLFGMPLWRWVSDGKLGPLGLTILFVYAAGHGLARAGTAAATARPALRPMTRAA